MIQSNLNFLKQNNEYNNIIYIQKILIIKITSHHLFTFN